ncbi:unnamed protein product [Colias eurytheme]|nr:unnamed protein product [Colias eurytheme]
MQILEKPRVEIKLEYRKQWRILHTMLTIIVGNLATIVIWNLVKFEMRGRGEGRQRRSVPDTQCNRNRPLCVSELSGRPPSHVIVSLFLAIAPSLSHSAQLSQDCRETQCVRCSEFYVLDLEASTLVRLLQTTCERQDSTFNVSTVSILQNID